jgi:putative hemolysin
MAEMSNTDAKAIVDELIEERAPGLFGNPLGRAFMRAVLFKLLHYDEAVELARMIHAMRAREIFDLASRNLALEVRTDGLAHVPARGPVLITPNHPTGIADGIVVYDALKSVRPDLMFFANRDALRVAPALREMIIPVEWVAERRTRQSSRDTLAAAGRAFEEGRCVVLFPAGRLAHLTWRGVVERPWQATAINLAKKHKAPIVPMAMDGRNSALFYAFSRLSNELRDVTLFRELLNKKGFRYRVRVGAPIDVEALEGASQDIAADLQHWVEEVMPAAGAGERFRRRAPRARPAPLRVG